jgi:lipid II:glycine glycyltransferase (peptidoglycan interpeptide bridge formation enzyme)
MTYTSLAQKKADSNSEILRNLFFDYASEENAFGFITYKDNKPSAMVFILKDDQTAYYLFGSFDKENQHEGAGALAMYSAIEQAKKLDLTTFDFSGSMIPSVEKYFRGFGGELIPMIQIVKASKKGKILLRIRRRKITK